jgi:ribulose-phosphate 3-epimerase
MINERGLNTLIEVDGGINIERGIAMKEAGADVLVAGNAIFKAENSIQMIEQFKTTIA